MNFEVRLEAVICGEDWTEEQVSEAAGAVMDALVDLGVDDPFVGGSLTSRKFEFAVVVEASSDEEAFVVGHRLIADSLRAARLDLQSAAGTAPLSWSQKSVRPAAAV